MIEIAPGLDLERDVLARMGFQPKVAPDLRQMDGAIFTDAPLGFAGRSPRALDERVDDRADDDLVFIDFEGLTLSSLEQAEELAAFLSLRLHGLARRVNVVVNYDNFELAGPAAPASSRCCGSTSGATSCPARATRPTPSCAARSPGRSATPAPRAMYRSFEEAAHALAEHVVAGTAPSR